jgi:hypothetical protein
MKNYFFIMFLISTLYACLLSPPTGHIVKRIRKVCNENDTCKIDMSHIVDVEWEKMYVFKTSAGLELINNKLGFSYPYYERV